MTSKFSNNLMISRTTCSRASLFLASIAGLAVLAGPIYADDAAAVTAVVPGGNLPPGAVVAAEQKAGGLTLQDCLALAAKNSPAMEQSTLSVDAAQQRLIAAKQAFKPTYKAGVHVSASSNPDVTFTGADSTLVNRENERATLSVHYTVSDGGKRKFTVQAAKAAVDSEKARGLQSQVLLLQETSLAYYNALHAQNAVDIGNIAVKTAEHNLEITQTRFSIGTVTRSDVLTATSAVDASKADLETRKLGVQDANAVLASLIGKDPSAPLELAGAQPPDWSLVEDLDGLLAKAQTASPLTQQISASRVQAEANLKAVKADRKPVITIMGEFGEIASQNSASGQYDYKPYALVGADVTMPLWNGTLQHAREAEQMDIIKAQDAQLKQLAIDLRRELAIGMATYHTSANRVTIAGDTVDNAQRAYQFAQDKYSAGKATEEDVVQALGLLSVARDQYQQSVNERDTAAQNLRWLTGLDMPTQYVDVN